MPFNKRCTYICTALGLLGLHSIILAFNAAKFYATHATHHLHHLNMHHPPNFLVAVPLPKMFFQTCTINGHWSYQPVLYDCSSWKPSKQSATACIMIPTIGHPHSSIYIGLFSQRVAMLHTSSCRVSRVSLAA